MGSLCFIEAGSLWITVNWQVEAPCVSITQRGQMGLPMPVSASNLHEELLVHHL